LRNVFFWHDLVEPAAFHRDPVLTREWRGLGFLLMVGMGRHDMLLIMPVTLLLVSFAAVVLLFVVAPFAGSCDGRFPARLPD
jgi:hypothetical protein